MRWQLESLLNHFCKNLLTKVWKYFKHWKYFRLWVECMIVRPCSQAIVALTFSIYASKPFFPECDPPDEAVRSVAGGGGGGGGLEMIIWEHYVTQLLDIDNRIIQMRHWSLSECSPNLQQLSFSSIQLFWNQIILNLSYWKFNGCYFKHLNENIFIEQYQQHL